MSADIFPDIKDGNNEYLKKAPRPLAYKTAAEKLTYQKSIRTRIRPYLAKYVATIKHEIDMCVNSSSLADFAAGLADSWHKHNAVN